MKKTFVIFLLLSQISFGQNLKLGPQLGVNFISAEKTELGNNLQPGFFGGIQGEYLLKPWFHLRAGINYSQKLQFFEDNDTSQLSILQFIDTEDFQGFDFNTYTETRGKINHHFIELPISAVFSLKNFHFAAGGYVGYLLAARTEEVEASTTPVLEAVDVSQLEGFDAFAAFIPEGYQETTGFSTGKAGLRSLDYGLKFGLGYSFDKLMLNGAYQIGLADYRTGNNPETLRHQFFQLSLTYFLPLHL